MGRGPYGGEINRRYNTVLANCSLPVGTGNHIEIRSQRTLGFCFSVWASMGFHRLRNYTR